METDTNPTLVQMIVFGEKVAHWYYRSDTYIDQPYFIAALLVEPYRGDPNSANPMFYGEGTYEVDTDLMSTIKKMFSKKE